MVKARYVGTLAKFEASRIRRLQELKKPGSVMIQTYCSRSEHSLFVHDRSFWNSHDWHGRAIEILIRSHVPWLWSWKRWISHLKAWLFGTLHLTISGRIWRGIDRVCPLADKVFRRCRTVTAKAKEFLRAGSARRSCCADFVHTVLK